MAESGGHGVFHPSEYYPTWTVAPAADALKHLLKHCTGWQCVPRPADQKCDAK
ncbi:hypothetical protein L484_008894 [Morus notabilis]|nr:hypothetical protein L484_008894 [Morus notabilis]